MSDEKGEVRRLVECVDVLLPGGRHLALSGDAIALLNDTLMQARKVSDTWPV